MQREAHLPFPVNSNGQLYCDEMTLTNTRTMAWKDARML